MKRSQFLLSALLGLLLFSSCTHTVYTHQQVLQNFHTKGDVWKQFGPPDERNPGQGTEQWVYDMDKPHNPTTQKLQDTIANQPNKIMGRPDTLAADSVHPVQPEKYARYVKFMFDDQGVVIGYKTEGVDLTHKEKDNFGKSLVTITGGILLLSALIALELYNDGAFQ